MRELLFEPGDADRRFYICYQALCFAPGELDGKGELVTHVDLVRKFHGIGVVSNPERGTNDKALYTCPGGGSLVATDPEWMILKRFLAAFIKNCSRALSGELLAAIRWADELPEKKDPPAAVPAVPATP